jgi:hypothetical protein
MVASVHEIPQPVHAFSAEDARAALCSILGDPIARLNYSEPQWHVRGARGSVWFELRVREDIPVLMIHRDLGCTSEIGDLMFLELRADADIRLLLRRLGVPDHVRVG